jgi:hypothetical protein
MVEDVAYENQYAVFFCLAADPALIREGRRRSSRVIILRANLWTCPTRPRRCWGAITVDDGRIARYPRAQIAHPR